MHGLAPTLPASWDVMPAGFLYPKPTGKYDHPWYKPLPKGRARAYDLLYMSATTLLAVAAGYTFFETGRGSYYIIQASRARGKVGLVCMAANWHVASGVGLAATWVWWASRHMARVANPHSTAYCTPQFFRCAASLRSCGLLKSPAYLLTHLPACCCAGGGCSSRVGVAVMDALAGL